MPGHDLELSLAVRVADSPDAPDQPPLVAQPQPRVVVAAVGRLEASRISSFVVVAVGDPLVPSEQVTLPLAQLVLVHPHPARLPGMEIEMDHWDPGLRTEGARERRRGV